MSVYYPNKKVTNRGLSADDKKTIMQRMKKFVQMRCTESPDKWFSARDFSPSDWKVFAPIKENRSGKTTECEKDCGWLLKEVLVEDPRDFISRKIAKIREYKLVR